MAAPPPVLTLAVTKGPREGDTRQCRAGATLRAGRVISGNDLAVRDAGVSQRHLAIEFLPPPAARWAVSDLDSSNGTFLNGARLSPAAPAPLSDGDLIKIGEDTVLSVSIAFDSDPNLGANPGPRCSSRRRGAAVEEKPLAATRRGGRKKTAAEPPNEEKEKPDAVEVVEAAETAPVVARRGGRKNAAAVAEAPNAEKEVPEAVEVVEVVEKPPVVPRRGGRRKAAAAEPSEAGQEEPKKEAAVATRRGGRKKVVEPPEPEKEKEEEEEVAAIMMCRGGRKKDAAIAAPPPPAVKAASRRGQGMVTRASARKASHEDEEEYEQEVAAPTEVPNRGGQAEEHDGKSDAIGNEGEVGYGVAAVDGEQEGTTKALKEEEPVAWKGKERRARRAPKGRVIAHPDASHNEGEEKKGGREEEDGRKDVTGSGGEVGDGGKVEKPARRSSLETMTLREWFERMEKYLPRMITEAADEMIAQLQERHRCVDEYISTLEESSGPA